jgi:hypothetical protein
LPEGGKDTRGQVRHRSPPSSLPPFLYPPADSPSSQLCAPPPTDAATRSVFLAVLFVCQKRERVGWQQREMVGLRFFHGRNQLGGQNGPRSQLGRDLMVEGFRSLHSMGRRRGQFVSFGRGFASFSRGGTSFRDANTGDRRDLAGPFWLRSWTTLIRSTSPSGWGAFR